MDVVSQFQDLLIRRIGSQRFELWFSSGVKLELQNGKLVVAGDSAGGNLAAAVALKASHANGPTIDLQVLIYPVVEPHFETKSYLDFAENHGLTRKTMQWFWQQYLGDATEEMQYAIPTCATDVSGLPPIYIQVGDDEILLSDSTRIAENIEAAGGEVTLEIWPKMFHVFQVFVHQMPESREAIAKLVPFVRARLGVADSLEP